MKNVEIEGVKYVPLADFGPIKIVALERGFIYVGHVDESDDKDIVIRGAVSLIRWGTTTHLGGLVNGPLENTKLGAPCDVTARWSQVNHRMEVSQDAWSKHCG